MKWQRSITKSLLILALVVAVIAFYIPVCRDWAFICENTGSQKGYRQWTFGPKTGLWYKKSLLEECIQSQAPDALVHRWTSYAGTGKNVLGIPVLFGHGRPGAVLWINPDILSRWIKHNDPATIRQLYDLLVSDDQAAIKKRLMEIKEEVIKY